MKHLIDIFPHDVTITSLKGNCYLEKEWLTRAGFIMDKDYDINWINDTTVIFGFKKARLAMEFKLTWG